MLALPNGKQTLKGNWTNTSGNQCNIYLSKKMKQHKADYSIFN